jgi:DNA-binding IscR family transcriptional regulator
MSRTEVRKMGRPKEISVALILEIQQRWKARPTVKSLAEEYGISESHMSKITCGKVRVKMG